MPGRRRRRYFWEQVASALHLHDPQLAQRLSQPQDTLTGRLGDLMLKAGASWSGGGEGGSSEERTFATVSVAGLPPGLEVDGGSYTLFAERTETAVECTGGGEKRVSITAVPIQLGELWLMQTAVDLDEYLTASRREVICRLTNPIHWYDRMHHIRAEVASLPFPKNKVVAQALDGDPEATQEMWRHRDQVVELATSVIEDARIAVGLAVDDNTELSI